MAFGRNSIVLAIAIANGWLLALLLWNAGSHRAFLRPLAALVALIALRLAPYMLGFAGAYDTWQWLTFAPFDVSLAFGPLVWCYVVMISTGHAPAQWRWHFAPAAIQVVYQLVAFALPLQTKWDWYTSGNRHVVEPIGLAAAIASLVAYDVAAWRRFVRWQRWMDEQLSNREAFRLGVVRLVLIAMAGIALLAGAFATRSWFVAPTDFYDRFPLVLALALVTYALGLAGWRQSAMTFPVMDASPIPRTPPVSNSEDVRAVPQADDDDVRAIGRPRQDYVALGAEWRIRVVTEEWFRDPLLTLGEFAQRLDVSPRTASRVLRDGLGVTFNAFINRLRVEAVQRRLADPNERRDVLPIALDAGFASKASFNRAFKDVTGTSPSAVRSLNSQKTES